MRQNGKKPHGALTEGSIRGEIRNLIVVVRSSPKEEIKRDVEVERPHRFAPSQRGIHPTDFAIWVGMFQSGSRIHGRSMAKKRILNCKVLELDEATPMSLVRVSIVV